MEITQLIFILESALIINPKHLFYQKSLPPADPPANQLAHRKHPGTNHSFYQCAGKES
jgi:hypothetical protein